MPLLIQNILLFQAGWFICVIGGANPGYTWLGFIVVVAIMLIHLGRAPGIRNEITLLLLAMFIGTLWDSSLISAGLLEFTNDKATSGLAPYWLIAMWGLFATTLNVSMKWLKKKYLLAAMFGAIGGPLSYYAGHRLGAVGFSETGAALLAVGAGWAVIMPALMVLAERFNGYADIQEIPCEVKTA